MASREMPVRVKLADLPEIEEAIARLTVQRDEARADRDSWKVIAQQNAEAVLTVVAKVERVRELAEHWQHIPDRRACVALIRRALDGAP